MYFLARASDFEAFYPYLLGYMILYMPTLALVNSVAFNQMNDPSKDFSKIRVWGTIGWILAGMAISFAFSWDSSSSISSGSLVNTFYMCSAASVLLGLFSFSLPKTPPSKKEGNSTIGEILGLDSLGLLKDQNYLIFFISSVLICIPLAFYYQNTNLFLTEIQMEDATGKMAFGQVSEVLFMLLLPVFLTKYGLKKTLLFGMLAWAMRYVLFAYGNAGDLSFMLLIGIALHGICYDFFFVSGQIYTDSKAGEAYKSSAQGLITLATYGVGMLIGFWIAGQISEYYSANNVHDWTSIWLFPAAFAMGVFIIFLMTFKNEKVEYK
jgi:nucleoside transporter